METNAVVRWGLAATLILWGHLWTTPLRATADTPSSAAASKLGKVVADFALADIDGKTHRLSDVRDQPLVVIAFLGTECPLAKLYGARLAELARHYKPQRVAFFGVNSNCQDTLREIAAYGQRHQIPFPLLKDVGNRLADQLQAQRTPEVFVLDQQRKLRYTGRIDDQYSVGISRDRPQKQDLRDALDDLLAGRTVRQPQTVAVGCFIGRLQQPRKNAPVTYSRQIVRLFQKHCVECHRDGEIGPFSLVRYDDVVGWADTIAEVVESRRMPPWHASPRHGQFQNARVLTPEERQLIFQWVRDGAPEGNPDELPAPRVFVPGWKLPATPDQVVAMRNTPFTVPSQGTVEYQYFVVDPEFTEDRWISAAEVIPGNRSVVHHVIVFYRPPPQTRRAGIGWLTAYVPGQSTLGLPAGQAKRVPAGSQLVFQIHYTPNGTPQQDLTRVGLTFVDPASVQEEVFTLIGINRDFEIPPHASRHRVTMVLDNFPAHARLLAIAPHMHLRGRSFRFTAHTPARKEVLLDVSQYDFNWQHAYKFVKPLELTAGLEIECVAEYDNSRQNLVNPDPTATVRWGDQSWEEMMVAYLEVAIPRGSPQADRGAETARLQEAQQQARRRASQFLKRFDGNKDGRIERDELPKAMARFAFDRFDRDGNQVIDEAEVFATAVRSKRRNDSR
ncbi:MAG: hypothetical protein CMJ75_05280 [Planctomycetaceae bacterium]|nr:hypothetical protein [Planctomycetaceae bacterium]